MVRRLVLGLGIGVLLFVPVFKTLTSLPPFMGMLLGLGVLWSVTELLHKRKNDEGKGTLSVAAALQRVDAQSVLFFLGILLAISALQSAGLLAALARQMDEAIGNVDVVVIAQRPKLLPHVDTMRANLARVLGCDVARVSVKGKTNEGVDAIGAGEAIAVHCVALLAGRR